MISNYHLPGSFYSSYPLLMEGHSPLLSEVSFPAEIGLVWLPELVCFRTHLPEVLVKHQFWFLPFARLLIEALVGL